MHAMGRWAARAPLLLLTVLALLAPVLFRSAFWAHLFDMILINALIAVSLNVILKTGQVSLAHAGFMAIGAFASAQLTVKLKLPFLAGFLLAGLLAAAVAFVLGLIILRLRDVYFMLFTFALGEFLYLLSKNVPFLTGGNTGIVGIRPPQLPFFPEPLRSKVAFYYLSLALVALVLTFVWALYRSPFGRAMNAVRESELLASSTGYHPMRIKVIAFAIGCLLAGFGGSLYAHFLLYIAPSSFTFWQSVNFLLMNIVGGAGYLAGPVVGAVVLTPLPELLRAYVVWQQVLYGVILMLFMRFLPDGIVSLAAPGYRRLVAYLQRLGAPAPTKNEATRAGEGA